MRGEIRAVGFECAHELERGSVPILRLVRNRPDQYALHLWRYARVDLTRARVLAEIKYQQWIVLRIRAREHMKHCGAQRINIRARFDLARKQLGRRVTHRPDRGDAFFGRPDNSRNAEIDEHHSLVLVVDHQIRRLEIAVDDRRPL